MSSFPQHEDNIKALANMNFVKLYDQRKDGGFDHYVVFGNFAPWDAPDDNLVKCASETDADKLMGFLLKISSNACDSA